MLASRISLKLFNLTLITLALYLNACLGSDGSELRRAPLPFEPVSLQLEMASLSEGASRLQLGDPKVVDEFSAQRLKPLLMSEAELLAMLQPKGGPPSPQVAGLIKRYQEVLAPAFLSEAPKVLARAFSSGLTKVKVSRVGPSRGKQNTPGDLKLLEALPKRPPLYHVRYLPHDEGHDLRGLRLNGFVYTPSGWRTFLKLGESLEAWRVSDLKSAKE